MAKRNRNELVSESFSEYISQAQRRLLNDTGKKFSRRDITAFIAMQQPVIKIEFKRKKQSNIFDF